ncbi:MAG TPA: kynureninase [Gammaproteobacteria bacterium]|nr:kynureninase [Gammaproteobacteria bacterium]
MKTAGNAHALDRCDELGAMRRRFEIPRIDGAPAVYLCGHSLGLMPRAARGHVERELARWGSAGVRGHFGTRGWYGYHRQFAAPLAKLTGALRSEVVAMNSLTVNLHLLLASFYRPQARSGRILIEKDAFPSDRYAVASQLAFHGRDPDTDLLELSAADPRQGIQASDLAAALEKHRGEVALVLLPGVQYLSGQVLDIGALTQVAQRHRCRIGFDLAHAIGNTRLQLHEWGPDFAVWCSYKYLNGGPGAIGGCFVHSRHGAPDAVPRLAGWWGHDAERRFLMEHDFDPLPGAEGWQLSNPPVLAMAPLRAALELFMTAGRRRLQKKTRALSAFMTERIAALLGDAVEICTPAAARGAQISLRLRDTGLDAPACAAALLDKRIVVDAREPDVLRLAAVPLYNRFSDIERALHALAAVLR